MHADPPNTPDTPTSPPADLRDLHTPEAISRRIQGGAQHPYLRDFVFGAVDGTVTTFAVVASVAGAELSSGIVLVLGLANLIGDGFSMAVGNYLGTRADEQVVERYRRMEQDHIDRHPEGERDEIRQIFALKGFEGADLERAVQIITAQRKRWVDMMLQEEWGLNLNGPNAVRAAWMTFIAFVLIGFIPLLAFVLEVAGWWPVQTPSPFQASAVLAGITFFLIGTAKSPFIERPWWRCGVETLLLGGTAATLAYLIGAMLKSLAGV